MSRSDDTAATLDALLAAVERDRDTRCTTLLQEARQRCTALLREARADARRLVHDAVVAERRIDRESWRRADARIETHRRLQQQRIHLQRLERGWVLLQDALRRRWHEAPTRRQWVEVALRHARLVLHADHWTISHPSDWPQEERIATHDWLHDSAGISATYEPSDTIEAGIYVQRDQACFDATLTGLLSARHRIEAQLLAEFEAPGS